MAIPNNVQAAIGAVSTAYDALQASMAAAVEAGKAKSASDQALASATAKAAADADSFATAKHQLEEAVGAWLTIPALPSPSAEAPAAK